MRSFVKRFGIIVFIAMIGFLFASCKNDPLNGTTWKVTSDYDDKQYITITFNRPNFTFSKSWEQRTTTGTYSVSDSTVTFTINGENITGTLAGNQLIFSGDTYMKQ